MQTRTIRDTQILLPTEEPDELDMATDIPVGGAVVSDAHITTDTWTSTAISDVTVNRSCFVRADLNSTRFTKVTLDRCVLLGCTLIGTRFDHCTLKNVIFENCRLDYATFDHLRASGPVAFLGCALTDATFNQCTLSNTLFDSCRLAPLTFQDTNLRGTDLRNNDLTQIVGIGSLHGAIVDDVQLPGLTEALVQDLALTVENRR